MWYDGMVICIHICKCVYIYAYIYIYIFMCLCIHIHIFIYIYLSQRIYYIDIHLSWRPPCLLLAHLSLFICNFDNRSFDNCCFDNRISLHWSVVDRWLKYSLKREISIIIDMWLLSLKQKHDPAYIEQTSSIS
jgi:hypothetical protein